MSFLWSRQRYILHKWHVSFFHTCLCIQSWNQFRKEISCQMSWGESKAVILLTELLPSVELRREYFLPYACKTSRGLETTQSQCSGSMEDRMARARKENPMALADTCCCDTGFKPMFPCFYYAIYVFSLACWFICKISLEILYVKQVQSVLHFSK